MARRDRRATAGILAGLVLAALAAAACRDPDLRRPPELWEGSAGPTLERRFSAEAWDTLWSLVSGASDTTLLHPYNIYAAERTLYVFDIGAQRLLALDYEGRRRWSFGRKGAGPDEFRNVRDVEVGADGLVYLLDPQNNRVVVMDDASAVRRRIRLDGIPHAEQMVPLPDGRVLLVTFQPDSPLVVVDTAGTRSGYVEFPWKGFTSVPPLARQGWTTLGPDSRSWVFAFMLGDGWFPFRELRPGRYVGRYVDHRPFPPVEEDESGAGFVQYTPCTGCDVAMDDSSLYVLSGGTDQTRRGVVDRFRLRDGAYVDSYRLPWAARRIAVREGSFYVVVDDPAPAIFALRPRP